MDLKKIIYVLFVMIITSQLAYADYYTQSLSLGTEKNEYTENIIKTNPDNEKNSQSAIVEYVQPIVYPVQYYTPTQIINYRNYPYPNTYFNYNRGGLSIGYNSNPTNSINPINPINPIKPHPPHHTDGGMKVYQTGTSFGLERSPKLLYSSQPMPHNGLHPHH